MNGTAIHRRRGFGALAIGTAGVLLAMQTAHADTTPTQTATVDLGDLDESGSGTFDPFDPALGTLTRVDVTAETTMDFDVCIHNRSAESDSLPAGSATGEAPIVFPADVVSNATGSLALPGTTLAATDGTDDCTDWLNGGDEPSSADSVLYSGSDVSPFSDSVTDPAGLAEYVGPGEIEYTYSASSDSSIGQPSEWTIIFLASGTAEVSITYTYEPEVVTTTTSPDEDTTTTSTTTTTVPCIPPDGSTTTSPGGGTTTTSPGGTTPGGEPCEPTTTTTAPCIPPGGTTTTSPGGGTTSPGGGTTTPPGVPCETTTTTVSPGGDLPTTGSGTAPTLAVAGILLAVGSGLVYTARRRSA